MSEAVQPDLFDLSRTVAAAIPGRKVFRAKNGAEVSYLEELDGTLKIEFGDGPPLIATKQGEGRYYANVPGYGKVQNRGKQSFLSQIALIRSLTQSAVVAATALESARIANERTLSIAIELEAIVSGSEEPARGKPSRIGAKVNQNAVLKSHADPATFKTINPRESPYFGHRIPNWLEEMPDVNPSGKLLYGIATDYFNPGRGFALSGVDKFMRASGLSERTVRSAFQALHAKGLVRMVNEQAGRSLCIYFLEHPAIAEWVERRGTANLPISFRPLTPAIIAGVSTQEPPPNPCNNCTPTPATIAGDPLQQLQGTPATIAGDKRVINPEDEFLNELGVAPSPEPPEDSMTRAVSAVISEKNPEASPIRPFPRLALPDAPEQVLPPVRRKTSACEDLMRELRESLGDEEMDANGMMWRKRAVKCPVALKEALGDLRNKIRTPGWRPKKNLAATLTDGYERQGGKPVNYDSAQGGASQC